MKKFNESIVCEGREKIDTDDILARELTVTAFDFTEFTGTEKNETTGEEENFKGLRPTFNFEEFPDKYYCGGSKAKELLDFWISMYDGDIEAASEAVAEEKIRIKFTKAKKKNGQPWIRITVI